MKRTFGCMLFASAVAWGCGGSDSSLFKNGTSGSGSGLSGSNGSLGSTSGGLSGGNSGVVSADGGMGIQALVRDFRFYDATDSTTIADFENPPYNLDPNGNPEPTGTIDYGPWDDRVIVTGALGSDGKPVYKSAGGTTLTTHGKAAFDTWYNDVANTNFSVAVPLALTEDASGAFTYDSSVSGLPYDVSGQASNSLGFFPIDDGTPYETPFGDEVPTNAQPPYMGQRHNYSFTVEIDTIFTYNGGETFQFTGDDDVFVYINGVLVINLGGVHGPESANVNVDSLGLTMGGSYALNFFSAERHVTGSNIKFTTTLHLLPAGPPPK